MFELIKQSLTQHLTTIELLNADRHALQVIEEMAKVCIDCLRTDHKVLIAGNGGSAADAQHLAAELSGRYLKDRSPLHVEALHVNTSYLTAVGNDYSFDEVYRRAVQAKGRSGDVLLALSTSGQSVNILRALEQAQNQGLSTLGMTGTRGKKMADLCDLCLVIDSDSTPRIQESHILVGHILCEIIEHKLFP